jgi:hypothetical protein
MAIQKNIELASGIICGYWICKEVMLSPETGEILGTYEVYKDKASYDAGKQPVDRMKTVRLQIKEKGGSWTELEAAGITSVMIKTMLYQMALAFPQFQGGTVVDIA